MLKFAALTTAFKGTVLYVTGKEFLAGDFVLSSSSVKSITLLFTLFLFVSGGFGVTAGDVRFWYVDGSGTLLRVCNACVSNGAFADWLLTAPGLGKTGLGPIGFTWSQKQNYILLLKNIELIKYLPV